MKIKRLICIGIILIMSIVMLCGCEEDYSKKELKGGTFSNEGGGEPRHMFDQASYYSEISEFDIDNVSLTFYFGLVIYDLDVAIKDGGDMPWFEMYFREFNEKGLLSEYLIRRNEESFISEKYLITETNRYSETIKMPKELFVNSTGKILFCIDGEFKGKVGLYSKVAIYYKSNGEKVILSNKSFDK